MERTTWDGLNLFDVKLLHSPSVYVSTYILWDFSRPSVLCVSLIKQPIEGSSIVVSSQTMVQGQALLMGKAQKQLIALVVTVL